jgi:hypothetical protein
MARIWLPVLVVLLMSSLMGILAGTVSAGDLTDEVALKSFVQSWVDVNRKGDLDALIALVAPDARLHSRTAKAKVSRDIWASSIKQTQAGGRFGTDQEATIRSIEFSGTEKAVMTLDTSSVIPTRGRRFEKEQWTLEKRGDRWVLVEKDYLD